MALKDDYVEFIKKQYLFCTRLDKFTFKAPNTVSNKVLDYNTQIKIFENTIEEPGSVEYPPALFYRREFLRMLIEECEKSGDDVYDKLYEVLADYMTYTAPTNPVHYRQFLLKHQGTEDRIILQENKTFVSMGTTGLHTWEASYALAEWCYVNRSRIRGKLVLELGSGVGLTGLSVVTTCAPERYTFSDCHWSVLDMLKNNVRLNFEKEDKLEVLYATAFNGETHRIKYRSTEVQITRVDWASVRSSPPHDTWSSPEVVLAADVIYDESLFTEFIEALTVFIARTNALVIVATTVRNNDTISAFFDKLALYELSFADETVPKPHFFLQYNESPIRILKIFNKN